jgi:trans-aconitate 2-methyltransferase
MQWDPQQYAKYGNERSRPFFELVSQVGAESPRIVVDLGCGPGLLTASLAERWTTASVRGIDSSPDMITTAAASASDRVSFTLGAAEEFSASGVDALISNALLQWVPGHRSLLQRWAGELNGGGWIAFQVPANFGSPSHQLMREVASSQRWRDQLAEVLRHDDAAATPAEYLELLSSGGLRVNAWQTEYLHVLPGDDPVLEWVRGTGLRPVLNLLSESDRAEFEAEYGALLRSAYPQRTYGTVFPFLRTFVVAEKA